VGLERGPLSLVRINEELTEGKSSGSRLKTDINGREEPPRGPHDTPLYAKVGTKIRPPAAVAHSVRLRTKSHGVCFLVS
jgi:hypothetical protein